MSDLHVINLISVPAVSVPCEVPLPWVYLVCWCVLRLTCCRPCDTTGSIQGAPCSRAGGLEFLSQS